MARIGKSCKPSSFKTSLETEYCPFPPSIMTRSGKVVYYDPKAGEYYDRDSDMYLSYDEYMSLDQETSAQKAAMKQGVFADPKSKEFKKMMKDKAKAEKKAKKQRVRSESLGMTFARKFYKGDKE